MTNLVGLVPNLWLIYTPRGQQQQTVGLASPKPMESPFTIEGGTQYSFLAQVVGLASPGTTYNLFINRDADTIFNQDSRGAKGATDAVRLQTPFVKNLNRTHGFYIRIATRDDFLEYQFTIIDPSLQFDTAPSPPLGQTPEQWAGDLGKQTIDILTDVAKTLGGVLTPYTAYLAAGAVIIGAIVLIPLVLKSAGSSIAKSILGD